MKRSDFFKSLITAPLIAKTTAQEKPIEPSLSGRDKPITPEDLELYIDQRIEFKSKIVLRGEDLIKVIK
jgi:hypothetical protein